MDQEVAATVDFLLSHVPGDDLPPSNKARKAARKRLCGALRARFEGHWHADNPVKGSAFRSLALVDIARLFADVPELRHVDVTAAFRRHADLVVWTDPRMCTYRSDARGGVLGIYVDPSLRQQQQQQQRRQHKRTSSSDSSDTASSERTAASSPKIDLREQYYQMQRLKAAQAASTDSLPSAAGQPDAYPSLAINV